MNTPSKIKRWSAAFDPNKVRPSPGNYSGTLANPEYSSRLGMIAAEFVHVEGLMATVLAVLLGNRDPDRAGVVLRAIKSPRGRIDVMQDLLELSPQNNNFPESYDQIIREFSSINRQRNIYVHGLWWTNVEDGSVYLAEENDNGLGFENARPVTTQEMDQVQARMTALIKAIIHGPMMDLRENASRLARLEQREPPKTS
jgi:hypothetical protein